MAIRFPFEEVHVDYCVKSKSGSVLAIYNGGTDADNKLKAEQAAGTYGEGCKVMPYEPPADKSEDPTAAGESRAIPAGAHAKR